MLAALAQPGGPGTDFGVKRAFAYGRGNHESMWLDQVQAGRVPARLADTPEHASGIHKGQRLSFPLGEVADWAYGQGGRLHGNFTLRAFRARLGPQERADPDAQMAAPPSPQR